jgi:hypothetical protein
MSRASAAALSERGYMLAADDHYRNSAKNIT